MNENDNIKINKFESIEAPYEREIIRLQAKIEELETESRIAESQLKEISDLKKEIEQLKSVLNLHQKSGRI